MSSTRFSRTAWIPVRIQSTDSRLVQWNIGNHMIFPLDIWSFPCKFSLPLHWDSRNSRPPVGTSWSHKRSDIFQLGFCWWSIILLWLVLWIDFYEKMWSTIISIIWWLSIIIINNYQSFVTFFHMDFSYFFSSSQATNIFFWERWLDHQPGYWWIEHS